MKTLTPFFFILFLTISLTKSFAQNYRNEVMKINNYVVKTSGHSKELSNNISPYQEFLDVEGLIFNQYPPDDPQTDDTQNWIEKGIWKSNDSFFLTINEGEWVISFTIYNKDFQVSIGDRVFTIGDSREETLAKLDLGYVFHKDNQNVVRFFYGEAFFYIYFKEDKINYFKFENTSY